MLDIFNQLEPFFEDTTREVGVREYARLMKVSPPTASTMLHNFDKQGLLVMREEYQRKLFTPSRSSLFIQLQRTYWLQRLTTTGLLEEINNTLHEPLIILFGSLAKAENTENSDVDIALIYAHKKASFEKQEKKLKRTIELFVYESEKEVPEKLLSNIRNGYILSGRWK